MRKMLVAVALAISLAACSVTGEGVRTGAGIAAATADAAGARVPATVSLTAADEKALTIAAKGVSAAAKSSTALVKAGVIKAGSPTALKIANALDTARKAINAAMAIKQGLQAGSYTEALAKAETALDILQPLLGG